MISTRAISTNSTKEWMRGQRRVKVKGWGEVGAQGRGRGRGGKVEGGGKMGRCLKCISLKKRKTERKDSER